MQALARAGNYRFNGLKTRVDPDRWVDGQHDWELKYKM